MELYNKEVIEFLEEYNFKYTTVIQEDCNSQNYNILKTNTQSQCQVANYLKKSGFPDYTVATMVCISKYESNYNCDATNKNTDGSGNASRLPEGKRSTDYGLMQINSYYWCSGDRLPSGKREVFPDPLSKYNSCNAACSSLFNCQYNTNCAYIVWKQQGYTAW
jgi:hypothetical protein